MNMNIGQMYQELFEDDDDEDDEILILIRKPYTVRPRPDFLNMYNEDEFLTRFRLCKETVMEIVELISEKIRTRTLR